MAETDEDNVTSNRHVQHLEERVRELERQFGRTTIEAVTLKQALAKSGIKLTVLLALSPLTDGLWRRTWPRRSAWHGPT